MKTIGRDFGDTARKVYAVASGALGNGKPVIVNSDETVSVLVGLASATGSAIQYEAGNIAKPRSAYMTNVDRVVIVYADLSNNYYGTAVVGTVSGANISFGTPVVFNSAQSSGSMSIVFDDNAGKVVISYQDGGTNQGESVVGTVDSSDNSISFGSVADFLTNDFANLLASYDSNLNKVLLSYRDQNSSNRGAAIVGTVSGTSISFGSQALFTADTPSQPSMCFDSNANKFLIAYTDGGDSNKGKSVVATISGTDVSFGSEVTFHNAGTSDISTSFDPDNNKILVAYEDTADSNKGKAVVGTISGTGISYGSEVEFRSDTDGFNQFGAIYDTNLDAHIITYLDSSTAFIETVAGQISGTTPTFSTPVVFSFTTDEMSHPTFDPDTNKIIVAYRDSNDSGKGKAIVLTAGLGSNMTTENFIGITPSAYPDGAGAEIQTKGAINEEQSGLTAGQSYFVQTDGTLGTTADDPSVFAGTAVSATKIIVKG